MTQIDATETFRQEAHELLEQLEHTLLEIGQRPGDADLIDSAFRALHTIKGSGAMFGFDRVAAFTHHVETAFDLVRKGKVAAMSELIALTLAAKDQMRQLIEAPAAASDAEGQAILDRLQAAVDSATLAATPAGCGPVICSPVTCSPKTCSPITHSTLKWDIATVNRILPTIIEGASLGDINLQPQLDLTSAPGQTLQLLVQTISASLCDESIRSTKATALLSEAALRLIFENFPHRLSERLNRRLAGAEPRHVGAAIEFMHANLHLPLTLGDIAQAAGVRVRSLQVGFQRFRDTTPLAYLRDIRLEAAHAELSLAENRLPVSGVALKWGFTQMGRFAARYRAAYGHRPSETARRARGTVTVSGET